MTSTTSPLNENGDKRSSPSPTMSQRLKDLGLGDADQVNYIEKILHPLMVAMTRHVVETKPSDPAGLLIKFLLNYKGAPSYLLTQVSTWLDMEQDQDEDQTVSKTQEQIMRDLQQGPTVKQRETKNGPMFDSETLHKANDQSQTMPTARASVLQMGSGPPPGAGSVGVGSAGVDSVAAVPEGDEDEGGVSSLSVAKRGINSISQRRWTDNNNLQQAVETGMGSSGLPSGAVKEVSETDLKDEDQDQEPQPMTKMESTVRTPGGTCLKVPKAPGALDSISMDFMSKKKKLDLSDKDKLEIVTECKQLKGLKKSDKEAVARAFEVVHYNENDEIMRHGEPCTGIHLIASGSARMAIPQDIATLEHGEMVGENAFLQDAPCEYNLTAIGPEGVVALHLPFLVCKVLGLKKKLAINTKRKHKIKAAISRQKETGSKSQKMERASLQKDGQGSVALGDDANRAVSVEDRALVFRAVKQNENLTDMLQLEDSQLEKIVDAVTKQFVGAGRRLVGESEVDDAFYIVHDGMFEVDGIDINTPGFSLMCPYRNGQLRAGDTFGELALLYDAPADFGIKAVRDSYVWVLTREAFRQVMRLKSEKRVTDYVDLVKMIPFLSDRLNGEEQEILADALEEQFFVRNEAIVTEGDHGNTFYIVFEGECSISKGGEELDTIGRGAWFGEKALLEDQPRQATITAASDYAIVLTLERMSFDLLLSPLEDLLLKHAGTSGILQARNSLLIMQHNMVKRSSQARGSIAPGVAHEKSAPLAPVRQSLGMLQKPCDAAINAPTERSELNGIGVLGTGSFGYVSLEESGGNLYALKALSKAHVVREGIQSQVQNERACMSMVNSTFIVKLYRTYQDEKAIYLLLEPAFGGELFDLYNNLELFGSVDHARFYAACITLGLDHLHSRRIVYRDLKFENCLISNNGYTKLTDLGIAKVVVGKTYTVCGTSDYFAPETLRQIGHNRAVDWWALGVMLFIAMSGRPPFDAPSVIQIYKNITKGFAKVAIPKEFDENTTGVITALCQKKPEERITMGKRGVLNLQEMAFFEKINWPRLTEQEDDAPYIPDIPDDPSQLCGKAHDDCAFLQDENQEYVDDGSGWDADF